MTIIEQEALPADISAQPASDEFSTEKVVTLAVAHGSNDVYFSFMPPLLPLLIEKLALSRAEAGLLTVFYQGPAIFQPFIGHLADRVSLRWVIILAPAISAAMITLIGIAPSYSLIALLLLIAGFSTAAFHSIAPAMVGAYSGKKIGRGMSIFMVGGELGFTIGPLAVVTLVGLLTLRGLPWLMSFGMLVSLILFLRLRDNQITTVHGAGEDALPLRTALAGMWGMMVPLMGFCFLTAFLIANLSTYLPTFMQGEGSSFFIAGASFSLVQFAATAGTLFSGWLSDRFGRRVILIFSVIVSPLLAFVFLAVRGWLQIPALLGVGFVVNCVNPTLMAMVQENFRQNRALANGLYLAINFVLRSLVVVLVGALGDRFGMRPVFIASAFIMFLALPFVFLLPRR